MPFVYLPKVDCVMARVAKSASTSILRCGFQTKVGGLDFAMKLPPTWANKFRFAFVRNPFERLVSAWQMFQKHPSARNIKFDARSLTLNRVLSVVEDESISVYDNNYWGLLKLHAIPMTHPHYRLHEADFIGKFESLESDWRSLCGTIGLEHRSLDRLKNSGRNAHYSTFYDPGTRKRAERLFAEDLVKFGYRFTTENPAPKTNQPKERGSKILFLCGVGRSGTTALRGSLGSHEQIYYNGFENNIIQDIASVAQKNCTMRSRKFSMAVDQEQYDASFRELLCSLIWPDKELAARPIHMAAINPTPTQLDYLAQLFKGSKYIGLIRNGIEVVSSRMEFRSFANMSFENHCDVWNRSANVVQWGKRNPAVFRLMRHEWLYEPAKLRSWMDELCDWLGIDCSESPQQHLLKKLEHPTSGNGSLNREAYSKSSIANKRNYFLSKRNRWRNWTPEQLAIFEDRCSDSMSSLNYKVPWNQLTNEISDAG